MLLILRFIILRQNFHLQVKMLTKPLAGTFYHFYQQFVIDGFQEIINSAAPKGMQGILAASCYENDSEGVVHVRFIIYEDVSEYLFVQID